MDGGGEGIHGARRRERQVTGGFGSCDNGRETAKITQLQRCQLLIRDGFNKLGIIKDLLWRMSDAEEKWRPNFFKSNEANIFHFGNLRYFFPAVIVEKSPRL